MRSGGVVLAGIVAMSMLAGGPAPATAGERKLDHSAADVDRLARENGLVPFAAPRRRGDVYEVDGVDEGGEPTHVVIDAVTGDLLWRTHRGVDRPRPSPIEGSADRAQTGNGHILRGFGTTAKPKAASASASRRDRLSEPTGRQARRTTRPAGRLAVVGAAPAPLHAATAVQPRALLVRDPLAVPQPPATAARSAESARPLAGTSPEAPASMKARALVPVAPLE